LDLFRHGWMANLIPRGIEDIQFAFFKITMVLILKWAMEQCVDITMLSKLWMKLYSNALFTRLSEFMKVVVLAMVQITMLVNGWEIFFPHWLWWKNHSTMGCVIHEKEGVRKWETIFHQWPPFVMELAIYKQTTMMHSVLVSN
jgi:hypothetical protein